MKPPVNEIENSIIDRKTNAVNQIYVATELKRINAVKLLQLDTRLVSGNLYPTYVIDYAIKKIGHTVYGEMGPIIERSNRSLSSIDYNNVSHCIENLQIHNGYLLGDVVVLNTVKGNIILDHIPEDFDNTTADYGFGLRAVVDAGKISAPNGEVTVERHVCLIISFDFVQLR